MAEHCYMEVQGIMGFSQSEADFADGTSASFVDLTSEQSQASSEITIQN